MTVRARVQFDDGEALLDLSEMPRIGEAIILPAFVDPGGRDAISPYRITDIAHYASDVLTGPSQRVDIRVRGSLKTGPRSAPPDA
nr:hypothetical protein [Mycobacterium sp. UM_NZ2]